MASPVDGKQALLEAAKQFAESAIAVTVGMDAAVFLPEDQKRHARLPELDRKLGPDRLLASPLRRRLAAMITPARATFGSFSDTSGN